MKLEHGKKYKNRQGDIVEVVKNKSFILDQYPFVSVDGRNSFSRHGRFWENINIESPLDLVAEVSPFDSRGDYVTSRGNKARVYAVLENEIHGAIRDKDRDVWTLHSWHLNGKSKLFGGIHNLVETPKTIPFDSLDDLTVDIPLVIRQKEGENQVVQTATNDGLNGMSWDTLMHEGYEYSGSLKGPWIKFEKETDK